LDRAIEIARRVGWPIKIAAKIDRADQAYFEAHIKRLLDEPGVEFLGEIGEREKAEFLGRARALLFPIDWREPFGIVMIEAMACGTPVVAYRNGSVPEVVEDGATGYIVDDLDGAERACARVDSLSRRGCREAFEARFTDTRMAEDYVALYRQLVEQPLKTQAQTALGTLR
jgi:glycosyltransferase involved in cell wall biosynthesis